MRPRRSRGDTVRGDAVLYQVTAYEVLGGIQLQVTTARTGEASWGWEHRILEHVELPSWVADDPWDVLWVIAQHIEQRAMERGSAGSRRPEPPAGAQTETTA